VLLSLESIAAQYAQTISVNETLVVTQDNLVLVAENVSFYAIEYHVVLLLACITPAGSRISIKSDRPHCII